MLVRELRKAQGALKVCHWGVTVPQGAKMSLLKPHLSQALKNEEESTRQGIKGKVSSQREQHVQRL